jgi:hypothetical protein
MCEHGTEGVIIEFVSLGECRYKLEKWLSRGHVTKEGVEQVLAEAAKLGIPEVHPRQIRMF